MNAYIPLETALALLTMAYLASAMFLLVAASAALALGWGLSPIAAIEQLGNE